LLGRLSSICSGISVVSLYIANTDNDWFDFLSSRGAWTEVNFWQPGGKEFHAIEPGEIFAFRLKSPRDKIGGFGVLSSASVLPLQIVWETFQEANGVISYDALRAAIARYRPNERVVPATNIGCRILVEPFFFPEHYWLDLPASWARNIVGGKRYSTDDAEGLDLWKRLMEGAQDSSTFGREISAPAVRYGSPTLITPRLGQGAFRIAVTESYGRQCAVSDGKVLPALDAAHIVPYTEGGLHIKANGILLRKDIHSILDAGYATVDSEYRFVVSNKVKEVFNNGDEYRRLHGKQLRLPRKEADWPNLDFLRWHNSERYLG
jgi:putative restriction endonuclease